MKKLLLSLVALLGVMNANSQVAETDLSAYDDAIYAPTQFILAGTTEANIVINIKSHTNFQSVEFCVVLPDGTNFVDLNGIETSRKRYTKSKGSEVYEYNTMADGSYKVIGTSTCDHGFAAGDDIFSYITIDVSELEAGEYPIIVKAATISGFIDPETANATGEADAVINDELIYKLIITDNVVLNENDKTLPAYDEGATASIELIRTLKKGEWGTIVLPFRLTQANAKKLFGNNVKFASFAGFTTTFADNDESKEVTSITVNFANFTSALTAGAPYLIQINDDMESFKVDGVKLTRKLSQNEAFDDQAFEGELGGQFVGTYTITTVPEDAFFISGKKIYYSTGNTTIMGYRGWFELGAVLDKIVGSSGDVKLALNVDGTPTDVNNLTISSSNGAIYNIGGQKMNNDVKRLQKGVYIIDGKKVAIK